jgi:membrane associated rhomboid family serine protease
VVFFADLVLPQRWVQSSPWIVAPALRAPLDVIDHRIGQIDSLAAVAREKGDADLVARLLEERSSLEVLRESRSRLLEQAEQAWELRRERGDYATRIETSSAGGARLVAREPSVSELVDPLAIAQADRVGPIRALLQFTTAQAMWLPQKWGAEQGFQFWRFVGYGLLHVNLVHLVFNMFGLWVFGSIVEQAFGRLRFVALFTLSVVIGALLYFLLNVGGLAVLGATGGEFIVPGLLFNNPYLPLIGASAGVYGVILASAWLRPNEEILVLYVLPVPLRYFALVLIGVSVFTLVKNGNNAGGEAAHLGGAIAGWWIAQRPHLLDDFFPFFHRIDGRRAQRPARGKSVVQARGVSEAEIDRILDKVRERGLASLTDAERDALRNATNQQRAR